MSSVRRPRAACRPRGRRWPGSRARRHALLDAVDDRELARALLELARVALGAPSAPALPTHRDVVERDRGLAREHRQQVAVGFVEAAEGAVDVGVEIAEQLALRDQRRDDARALRRARRRLPARAQARRAGAARLRRATASTHPAGRVASSPCGSSEPREPAGRAVVEHQQHALRAGELRGFVDQELVQLARCEARSAASRCRQAARRALAASTCRPGAERCAWSRPETCVAAARPRRSSRWSSGLFR